MIRFIFRTLAVVALAVAVVMAVLDATRSIAASALVLTPLGESWRATAPESLDALREAVLRNLPAAAWDPGLAWILALPGFLVFAALALLLYLVGHRPERRIGRLA